MVLSHCAPLFRCAPYRFSTSENGTSYTQLIQAVDLGDNGQNQKIITIQLNLAEAYTIAKQYDLAIVTYTGILHNNAYNGCALLGRADVYKKLGQLDNASKDENIGNMLKPTCITGGTNFQKPTQPSEHRQQRTYQPPAHTPPTPRPHTQTPIVTLIFSTRPQSHHKVYYFLIVRLT